LVFSSVIFLAFFLPALLLVYFLVPKGAHGLRNGVLLLFSLFFYACAGLRALPLILFSIVLDFVLGKALPTARRPRSLLAVGLIAHLGLLFWFKYANFAAANLARLGLPMALPQIVLPVGISFFTFQGISYLIDVYRGDVAPEGSLVNMALYIALFPQLIAGPIVRYRDLAEELQTRQESADAISDGALRFLWGLGKKVLLSNSLVQVADAAFTHPNGAPSVAMAWLGLLCYALHIYFDFSGYSDMAIGLGLIFGFHFPENFRHPYAARSISDFWRRWHISLSSWFRDYLYIPLGGSRAKPLRVVGNLLLVWASTGLWHGAAWTFLVWGLYFGLLLIGEKFLWKKAVDRAPPILQHLYALLFILLGWVWFRAEGMSAALAYFRALFGLSGGALFENEVLYYLGQFWPELLAGVLLSVERPSSDQPTPWRYGAALLVGLLSVGRLLSSSSNPFIYFRF